nr:MAG TPA: hypothetical protein [Caudoviricetes sp.]
MIFRSDGTKQYLARYWIGWMRINEFPRMGVTWAYTIVGIV